MTIDAPIEAAEAGVLALPWTIRGDWVVNANGYAVCTPPAAEAALIVDRVNGWDALVAENAKLRKALQACIDRHVALVESGDCGFWNPEEEDHIIQARAALSPGA